MRKAGYRLRITAQLIKVADDTHLWSETYNREIEDVFAIQEEISNAIAEKLKIQILGKEKKPIVKTYTENMDAYESLIKGRYCYYSFMEGSMEKAFQYYKQALTLDPNYAPAYSAIAEYYATLPGSGQKKLTKEEILFNRKEARKAINTALEIDDNLPEAYANLGLIKLFHEWDWKGAEKAFETALQKQMACLAKMEEIGKKALETLEADPEQTGVVIFGRPYNAFADEAHMGIPHKLASRGVLVLPLDFLPLDNEKTKRHMYWGMGQRIMMASRFVKKHPQIFGTFITNFSCGPDSFIIGYFREIMGRKPSLTLELHCCRSA